MRDGDGRGRLVSVRWVSVDECDLRLEVQSLCVPGLTLLVALALYCVAMMAEHVSHVACVILTTQGHADLHIVNTFMHCELPSIPSALQ